MDKSIVVCFSQEKENLKQLQFELNDYFGESVDRYNFHNESSVLKFAQKHADHKTELIVVDLTQFDDNTVPFINNLNAISPDSVKLIIGKSQHLLKIQLGVSDNHVLHYLKRPWSKTDLLLAINSSSTLKSGFHKKSHSEEDDQIINKKVEQEISKKLKELIEANYAKDKYLSIIAHDLKSPFLGLIGLSEILLRDWDLLSEENKLELIVDIHKTSEETYKLLEDLLNWAKSQREKLEVSIQEIMVRNVVDSSIRISENNAIPKGIEVQNKIKNNLKVNADEKMMATVFRNLISNAVKFTGPGGKIKITAREEKNYCTFCVSDNGEVIDKQDILDLFNPNNLNKLKRKTNAYINDNKIPNFKGLGLILCKDFVEKNGGRIWLETQKGVGSKFYFTVPY